MLFRLFFWLIGFGLAVSGGISTIAYLNIITAGQDFVEYIIYISGKPECILLPIGIVIVSASIFYPSKNKLDS
ncbi:hypothetical protein RCG23_06215 [Neobacillus sp. PS3-34]|uniref:hypothetical protein n=1 Tax=Neobacillus sp. PS3-34 TaxID=3070678 RepID=UPI0027E04B42|nr:hypothetical protein [Neobacillus sp. PS3-34]WML49566.1 hypothetical protein RCG23_06215 [Neobacillus sp. PS3-34]